jgi:type I restriction enzyme S subunit
MIGCNPDTEKLTRGYLKLIWGSSLVRNQIERGARTTNGTFKINQSVLSGVMIPIPPLALQNRFAEIVESVERQKARLRAHLAELDQLFASLQSRAFKGELTGDLETVESLVD